MEETMREILLRHAAKYPLSRPQDMVKLLYQAEFGGGHLLKDRITALKRLKSELQQIKQTEVVSFEKISPDMTRFSLKGFSDSSLSEQTVVGLFAEVCAPQGGIPGFRSRLDDLKSLTREGHMPFSLNDLNTYLTEYEAQGYPMVSHSDAYRAAYEPAYRLMPDMARKYLPVFAALDRLLSEKSTVTVKIDGDCASGKTTLAALLGRVYQVHVFHMDDYFLPLERKTARRLAEPGGNVDRERFAEEIDDIPVNAEVIYRPFSCQEGCLMDPLTVPPQRLRIVEGAYSLHPALKKPDLSVFLSIDPAEQKARILKRNGEKMLERFVREWIPLEKKYFAAFSIQDKADLVFRV